MSHSMNLNITLNGEQRAATVNVNERLSDVLRRLGCASVKIGCNEGACGSCAISLNGRIIDSCLTYAVQADGGLIETVESIGSLDHPHPIQAALVEAGAVQCGFCMPGMIMAAKALFDKNPSPTDEEMAIHLDGQLCRCTGYEKIQTALRNVAASSGAPARTPGAPVANPNALARTPGAPVANPDAPARTPGAPVANPDAPARTPGALARTPNAPVANPDAHVANPGALVGAPDAPVGGNASNLSGDRS